MVHCGVVHGDLSAYNILWDQGRIVIIDFPQSVDPIVHPEGISLLDRDVTNVTNWFARRGIECDAPELFDSLLREAFRS
jgi:RIO kinase 1